MKIAVLLMIVAITPACVTTAQIKRCVNCLNKHPDLDRFSDGEKYNICEKGLRRQWFEFEVEGQPSKSRDSLLRKYPCF